MTRFLVLGNPRTGSTYLINLLNSHEEIGTEDELLQTDGTGDQDPLVYVEQKLAKIKKPVVGFKAFTDQLKHHNLRLDELVKQLKITHIIVLWRKNFLESFVSLSLAIQDDVWVAAKAQEKIRSITLLPNQIKYAFNDEAEAWENITKEWPSEAKVIQITYEELVGNTIPTMNQVLRFLDCRLDLVHDLHAPNMRQNPASLQEKISNWNDIPEHLKNLQFDVKAILEKALILRNLGSCDLNGLGPDREPEMPSNGWLYRVAEPFISSELKQNVMDALMSGNVSSASFWPKLLSSKLKLLFTVPVAQPCSNGFSALLLALQAIGVTKDDEVIVPSFTMVAVANAVSFLGGRPMFVDNASDDYNPAWEDILPAMSEKTKAVILTHTYGVPSRDLPIIAEKCKECGVILIEDISECVGVKLDLGDGEYKLLGSVGDMACASLYANKMVHGGDGGFVIAKDPKLAPRLVSLVNHGFTPAYHFVHYELATNAKMNGVGAAMACACIDSVEEICNHRALVASCYRTHLGDLPLKLMYSCGVGDTPWVFGFECESKDVKRRLRTCLAESGIETRDYFFPLHLQPLYKHLADGKIFPNCEKLGTTGMYLPTHSNLSVSDVVFICAIIRQFFIPSEVCKMLPPAVALENFVSEVQVKPGSFSLGVRTYDKKRSRWYYGVGKHPLIQVVKLGLDISNCLREERWDQIHLFQKEARECLAEARKLNIVVVEDFLVPFLDYLATVNETEWGLVRPWLSLNLDSSTYEAARKIPTTTDPETLQLLAWLVQEYKPQIVWDFGSWFGHSACLSALAGIEKGNKTRVFACDVFKWQKWMSDYVEDYGLFSGQNFVHIFEKFTKKVSHAIEIVKMQYDLEELPTELQANPPDLVFIDFTREDDELEHYWNILKPSFLLGKTLLLFNGICSSTIPFLTRHSGELQPIAKPHTAAKAFRYIAKDDSSPRPSVIERKSNRKVFFQRSPNWEHLNRNWFAEVVSKMKERFHNEHSKILFFPSVENTLCDEPELLIKNPWVGIIHSVSEYLELFYVPDLKALCSPYYERAMRQCMGLFTLTIFQADYLRNNLPAKYVFPIQAIHYPIPDYNGSSTNISAVPELWEDDETKIDLIFVGSYARDFDLFFRESVPPKLRKVLLLCDDWSNYYSKSAPGDVLLKNKLSEEEYECHLMTSIPFLALKYEGAANTLMVECISRNIPLVAPNTHVSREYLGENYPLLYPTEKPDLVSLITKDNVRKACDYLARMDKRRLSLQHCLELMENGAVMASVPGAVTIPQFDVTVCICSYKRTHHLGMILERLWNGQDFDGTYQILIWNNNEAREAVVKDICKRYTEISDSRNSLELISSSANYYCSIRFALASLMKSERLLICDDDVIPNENFISFFVSKSIQNPEDVLCVRGHLFLEHQLDVNNPGTFWEKYQYLRFRDDHAEEQYIHFAHADACLIPKKCLHEVASQPMPDPSFNLVDDYWMSFILSQKFGRKILKLNTKDTATSPLNRTSDSDTLGLALHTRAEVQEARNRLYVHHMLQGWPKWPQPEPTKNIDTEFLKNQKLQAWNSCFMGYNVSSRVEDSDIEDLCRLGVNFVRIGAVGVTSLFSPEFEGFNTKSHYAQQIDALKKTVSKLAARGIRTVITLTSQMAKTEIWELIAETFVSEPFVVGYDLINEPYTACENNLHWKDVSKAEDYEGTEELYRRYERLIHAIRKKDQSTPIVVEPSFWAQIVALDKFPIQKILNVDQNMIVSVHFYDPKLLTDSRRNKNNCSFPGNVPIYNFAENTEYEYWDQEKIDSQLRLVSEWATRNSVKLFVGEFGICRRVSGGPDYLDAVISSCKKYGISSFVYSFRDVDWDGMDYELGCGQYRILKRGQWRGNPLMETIMKGFK